MEFLMYQQPPFLPWQYLLTYPSFFSSENQVHWAQTPESHIYSADLTGVRKEEIKVEVEDSIYLIIRTEAIDEETRPAKTFMRKFRLPGLVDIDGISAGYEDGVLTVTVPRSYRMVHPSAMTETLEVAARAA